MSVSGRLELFGANEHLAPTYTYASWLVMAGVDLFRVKELLGHASIETTMRYAHLQPKSFKSEIECVFGDGAEPGRVEDGSAAYRLAA